MAGAAARGRSASAAEPRPMSHSRYWGEYTLPNPTSTVSAPNMSNESSADVAAAGPRREEGAEAERREAHAFDSVLRSGDSGRLRVVGAVRLRRR